MHSWLRVVPPGCPHIPHRPGYPVTWTSSCLSGELMGSPVYPHPGQQLPACCHPFAGLPPMFSEPVPWYSACMWLSGPHSPSPLPLSYPHPTVYPPGCSDTLQGCCCSGAGLLPTCVTLAR